MKMKLAYPKSVRPSINGVLFLKDYQWRSHVRTFAAAELGAPDGRLGAQELVQRRRRVHAGRLVPSPFTASTTVAGAGAAFPIFSDPPSAFDRCPAPALSSVSIRSRVPELHAAGAVGWGVRVPPSCRPVKELCNNTSV
jgi:hypothetical protein